MRLDRGTGTQHQDPMLYYQQLMGSLVFSITHDSPRCWGIWARSRAGTISLSWRPRRQTIPPPSYPEPRPTAEYPPGLLGSARRCGRSSLPRSGHPCVPPSRGTGSVMLRRCQWNLGCGAGMKRSGGKLNQALVNVFKWVVGWGYIT